MHKLIMTIAAALALAAPGLASAASGTVRGTWKNYQNQGNYCDPGTRNCTSSRYLISEYHTYHPISDTKIYIKDPGGVVIGTGVTNSSGYFSIVWNRASTPAYVRVYWQFEHKDDRFKIRNETGAGIYSKWTEEIPVTNGSTVDVGNIYAGTSSAISGLANIYDGADRMWNDSLKYSGRMQNIFTGLTIRAYPEECPTACANSGSNWVKIPAGAEFKPQHRILHEMGHIAAGKAAGAQMDPGGYCYPDETTGCGLGWSMFSNEWRGAALKEAMATVLGDIALYWSGAVDPRSCLSAGECPASSTTETSGACSGTMGRQPMQVVRYLWDTYDSRVDGADNVQEAYYVFVDALAAIPSGYNWGQLSSYRDAAGNIDCWDCFHPWEWRNAVLNHWSGATDTQGIYFQNCMGYF
ncbi:MAG TPA: hypothetical protein VK932_04690 [Kofleriaceae bacterium]|nr:hypothetical protein [Kofleriaceae bacterium]